MILLLHPPLIFQFAVGIGTLIEFRLPRFHRAGPSTSLDKSAPCGLFTFLTSDEDTDGRASCQDLASK